MKWHKQYSHPKQSGTAAQSLFEMRTAKQTCGGRLLCTSHELVTLHTDAPTAQQQPYAFT